MPIAPFIAINSRGATTPQARRYINMSPTPFGATFGSNDTNSGSGGLNSPRGTPAIIKFGGSQTFLATVGTEIYRSTDGGTSWTLVKTFTAGTHIASARSVAKSGLWVLHPNGVATAVVITHCYPNTDYYAHYSTNGTSWTTVGPFVLGTAGYTEPTDFCVWRGRLCVLWAAGDFNLDQEMLSIFDPVTNTMTFALTGTQGSSTVANGAMCVFNDRLFTITRGYAGSARCDFKEYVAGSFVTLATDLQSGGGNGAQKIAMFVDGANMYAWQCNSSAWIVYKWTSALVRSDITTSVKPTGLAAGTDARMHVIVDNRSTPGSTPTIWLVSSTDGGASTTLNLWKWNGDTSFIGTIPGSASSTPDDTGGTARDNVSFIKHSQGVTFWTSGEDHIEMKGFAAALGGLTVSFKLYSDAGTGTANVRAWQGVATDEYPLSPATLTGAGGTFAKDNTTTYSIGWSAQTDGFATGQYAKFILEKY
jgi:hypothetical protein